MAKNTRAIKAAKHGNNSAIEHVETTDDSILPDPEILAKYQEIDPSCLPWLKVRLEEEQNARLSFNDRRMTHFEKTGRRNYHSEIIRIFCAFIIILSAMALSGYLIYMGKTLEGSIFAGSIIIIAATAFLNFKSKKEKE